MNAASHKKHSPYRWLMLILITVPFLAVNASQYQLSAWSADFMADLDIGIAQFSAVMFSFSITNALLAAFGGALEDKYGVKPVVVISGLLTSGCAFARLYTTNYFVFLILSLLIGCMAGTVVASLPKIIGAWFPENESTLAFSISCCGGGMGIAFAQITSSLFAGYRQALMFSAFMLLGITVLWIIFGKDTPDGSRPDTSAPVLKYLRDAGRIKEVWMIALCAAGFAAFLGTASGLMPVLLPSLKGMEPAAANTAVGLLNLVSIPGAFILPFVQGKAGTFKPVLIIFLGIVIASVAFIYMAPGSMAAVFFSLGGFFFGVTLSFYMSMVPLLKNIDPACLGSANGIVSLVQHIVGTFLYSGIISAKVVDGSPDSIYLLCILPCAVMIIITLLLPEVGRKNP